MQGVLGGIVAIQNLQYTVRLLNQVMEGGNHWGQDVVVHQSQRGVFLISSRIESREGDRWNWPYKITKIAINKLQQQIKFTQDSLDSHIRATREPVRYIPTKEEDEIIKTAFAQLEFESAKAIIKQSSYSSLDGLAMLLKSHPEWSVTLKGYTDNSGNAAKNLQLSKDRAASVKNYLINKGVSAANIQSQGYGSANPVASNSTLAGRAKNRRVEIELFSK